MTPGHDAPGTQPPANPQKARRGLSRLWHALGYSLAGLRAAWFETAFRQELIAATVLLPLAAWLGRSWVESALLAVMVLAVLVVELLNTAVESAIDRFGPDWHPQSKRAKDLGSAAVLLTLLACALVWTAVIAERLGAA